MYRSTEIFLLCLCFLIVNCEKVRYDSYRVYKVIPTTRKQIEVLETLNGYSDSLMFLNAPHQVNDDIDVIVAPHKVHDFVQALLQNGIAYNMIESNAQKILDKFNNDEIKRDNPYAWRSYRSLDETYAWLDHLDFKYSQVEIINAGRTYEGRKIKGIKVSFMSGNKGIFVEGGVHAREWITSATTTYILNALLTSHDPEVRKLALNYDWYFIPHANPDGYVYSYTTDRLWRKTRSPNGPCIGTDLNRNWGFHWNETGTNSNPCASNYPGKKSFSEIETKSLSDYITSVKEKISVYISFHSHSQMLLWPYGYSGERIRNDNDLRQIADVSIRSLSRRYGTRYRYGNVYDAVYPASGSSIDWVYGVLDIPLVYCFELRPTHGNWDGFNLHSDQIIPTSEEILDSILALIKEAQKLKYL